MVLSSLFPALLLFLLVHPTGAEKHRQVSIDYNSIKPSSISPALFGTIHGSGSVDFAKLHYDFEGTVTAAAILLPNAKEWRRLQKWQTDDTASSRARYFEYLSKEGLGALGNDGVYYPCCSTVAVQADACDREWNNTFWEDDETGKFNLTLTGNMIVAPKSTRFRVLDINASSTSDDLGLHGVLWFGETRKVALMFGNCDANATQVHIHGTVTWTSYVSASTLPLYAVLLVLHGGLCLWYRECMNHNKDSRIPVEEWIFFTLFLATVSIMIKTIYYATEAFADDEWLNLSFAAAFSKSIARAVSRCLYLLLAMGVGVTTPTLENKSTIGWIGLLLSIFIVCDFLEALTIYDIVVPFFEAIFWTVLGLSLIFMIWIPVAIHKTMKFLEYSNETHKLERYQWIWRIYLLSIGLAILQFILFIVDLQVNAGRDYDFMEQDEQGDITYLIILTCMAYLWKPNPSQQMYSYQMLGQDTTTPANMSLELSGGEYGETNGDVELSDTAGLS